MRISCYRTIREKLPKAFCMLAEKCYNNGIKVFVYTNSKEYILELDEILWTFSKKQFIPHGTIYDPFPEKQPILIGSELKNLNNSLGMIIINASLNGILPILSSDNFTINAFKRLFFLYDQTDPISASDIKEIVNKSSLAQEKYSFETYIQSGDNSWQTQDD